MSFFNRKDPRIAGRQFVLSQIKAELERLMVEKAEKVQFRAKLEEDLPGIAFKASLPKDEDAVNWNAILLNIGQNAQFELERTICEIETRMDELWDNYITVSDEIAAIKAGRLVELDEVIEREGDDITQTIRDSRERSRDQGQET